MDVLTCHAIVATLQDLGFGDWRLPTDDAALELRITTAVDWPVWAAAAADLSGGLGDLPDDCEDEPLLELVRHGITLVRTGVVSEADWLEAGNDVMRQLRDQCEPLRQAEEN
jgi:hypothetical protein